MMPQGGGRSDEAGKGHAAGDRSVRTAPTLGTVSDPAVEPAARRPHPAFADPAAVLVDMDGTLLDSERLWEDAQRRLAEELGLLFDAEIRATTIGTPAEAWLPGWIARAESGASLAELVARIEDEVVGGLTLEVSLRPGAQALLEALASSPIPSALVSASVRRIMDAALDEIVPCPFSAVVSGSDVSAPKPHPDPYLLAARLLGVDASNCLAIEDSVTGARSASAAGCAVVWIPTSPAWTADPDWCVLDSLEQLDLTAMGSWGR